MEDRGYLVAHPTLVDPKGHAPLEQQHITHKVFFGHSWSAPLCGQPEACSVTLVFCLVALTGAPGGKRHPEPPKLCEEEPVQQLQRPDSAEILQVQYQPGGKPMFPLLHER